jgi:AcrR family transcriptional regulator
MLSAPPVELNNCVAVIERAVHCKINLVNFEQKPSMRTRKADTPTTAKTNQQGQALGRKGLETRKKLMAAARKFLDIYSPVELTAVAIAKEAGTSSASFYMYFDDVRDILYALAIEAGVAMASVHEVVEQPWGADTLTLHEHALQLVERFNEIWQMHRQVLRFRNLEADRGDPRFEALRMETYVPFIDLLARQIIAACPPDKQRPTLSQAFALASVLHASMERMASTDPAVVARGLGARKVNDALAHLVRLVFGAGAPESQKPAHKAQASSATAPGRLPEKDKKSQPGDA